VRGTARILRLRSTPFRSATGDKLPTVIPSAATAQPWRSRGIHKIASHENMKSWVNRAFRHPWPRCHGAIWFDFAPLRSAALTMTVSHPKQCCPRAKLRAQGEVSQSLPHSLFYCSIVLLFYCSIVQKHTNTPVVETFRRVFYNMCVAQSIRHAYISAVIENKAKVFYKP
jgi:hypothetical protein